MEDGSTLALKEGMKTKNFIKNFIRVSLIVLVASVQIACSKDKKDNNNNSNGYYGQNCYQTQQYPNQQYPNQQYQQQYPNQYPQQQYPNQNCGGYGGNGGMGQPQQCYGFYSTQPNGMGQSGYCQGQNCAGYLLYNQNGQPVQCM